MAFDPKLHIEQYGVTMLDTGTLRNIRTIAQINFDRNDKIRSSLPDEENTRAWDEAMGQEASDDRWVIDAVNAELAARGLAD